MAEAMYKEDAERLAEQIIDENQMVDIIDVRMDPDRGNYVIIAYDSATDEEILVDSPNTWESKRNEFADRHVANVISVKVHERQGRKIGSILGRWTEVAPDDYPDHICDAIEERRVPGESLSDLEPRLEDADVIYPGKGKPDDYGFDGNYLVMLNQDGAKVFRHIIKLANFTLMDQTNRKPSWQTLGFDIDPKPLAPFIEPGAQEWTEKEVADEVRSRMLDIMDQGYGAILINGETNMSAYAWLFAGIVGIKVVTAWEQATASPASSFTGMGYSEMLHYKEIEEMF